MSRDAHVRFREELRVKFPRLTRLLILCKTKRQLNRCRRRMMEVLQERRLSLSRKKSYIGSIKRGFHYLGIYYPPTQPAEYIKVSHADGSNRPSMMPNSPKGGAQVYTNHQDNAIRILPHPRTLRKARENVKWMVACGVSLFKIRNYLHRYVLWWQNTSDVWQYTDILKWFIDTCRESQPKAVADMLLQQVTLRSTDPSMDCWAAA